MDTRRSPTVSARDAFGHHPGDSAVIRSLHQAPALLPVAGPTGVGQAGPDGVATGAQRLHIGIAGPVATRDIRQLLNDPAQTLPAGYDGAPLMAALIQALIAQGHRVSTYTLSTDMPLGGPRSVLADGPNFSIEYCAMRPRAWRPNGLRLGRILDFYAFERCTLEAAIVRARPDVVHAHWAYEFAWAGLRSGRPCLVTSHDSPFTIARFYKGFTLGGYRWLRAMMAWHVLRHARAVSTVSPYMAAQIQHLCRVPVQLVPNPLGDQVFAVKRVREPGRCRVLIVCNGWSAHKNPEPALRAFAAVALRMPRAELVVLGHGFGPGQQGEGWWRDQGLQGNVRFIGAVAYPQVLQWMAQSDLLLHPSVEESFGAVIAEAMAVGLPVVAGQASGAVPWVVGEHGRLVDVHEPAAMAAAMLELLSDTPLRETLGHAARTSVASRFSAAAVVAKYLDLYAQVRANAAAVPA